MDLGFGSLEEDLALDFLDLVELMDLCLRGGLEEVLC
jgi:hypothetical protein